MIQMDETFLQVLHSHKSVHSDHYMVGVSQAHPTDASSLFDLRPLAAPADALGALLMGADGPFRGSY